MPKRVNPHEAATDYDGETIGQRLARHAQGTRLYPGANSPEQIGIIQVADFRLRDRPQSVSRRRWPCALPLALDVTTDELLHSEGSRSEAGASSPASRSCVAWSRSSSCPENKQSASS